MAANCAITLDEQLIEAVRSFPSLWQVTAKGYKDQRARENGWRQVANKITELSIEECQRKWKTLRDRFVRELKKVNGGKSGDSGPKYTSPWPLYNTLLFLGDSVKHRTTTSNFLTGSDSTPVQVTQDDESREVSDTEESFAAVDPTTTSTPIKSASCTQPPAKKKSKKEEVDDVSNFR